MNINGNDNDNRPFPSIQLLVPSCQTVDDAGSGLTWLHGFCLVTFRPVGPGVQLGGIVRVGARYGENPAMVRELAKALDPAAVLAGDDLTSIVGSIGRLPIEANDQQPALDVLAKLKAMLMVHDPIDLAMDDHSRTEVLVQHIRLLPGIEDDTNDAINDAWLAADVADRASVAPQHLAVELIQNARACVLAIGEIYLDEELRPALLAALENWERTEPLFTVPQDAEDGGGSIIIN